MLPVLALAMVLAAAVLAPGCLTGPEAQPTPTFSMKVIGGRQTASAGDNLTFIVLMKNNQPAPDTAAVAVSFMPAGWAVSLSNTTFEFTSLGYRAVYVIVNTTAGSPPGSYEVKLRASSALKSSNTGSATLKVKLVTATRTTDIVSYGNNLQVDYIGYLSDYTVFDTSVREVGSQLAIPKAPMFQSPVENQYQPLAFQQGQGQMIKGFDSGVLGMQVGQSRTLRIEPKDGYGLFETVRINLTESFPMVRNISPLCFTETFGEEPEPNKVVVEPFWGWQVHVLAVSPTAVTVLTLPEPNQVSTPYGWESKVIEVNGTADGGDGRITVRHYPAAGVNATYRAMPAQLTAMTSSYVELTYNIGATKNALALEVLYFSVKIVSLM